MTADLRRLVKKMWRCYKYPSLYARQRNHKQVRGTNVTFSGLWIPENTGEHSSIRRKYIHPQNCVFSDIFRPDVTRRIVTFCMGIVLR